MHPCTRPEFAPVENAFGCRKSAKSDSPLAASRSTSSFPDISQKAASLLLQAIERRRTRGGNGGAVDTVGLNNRGIGWTPIRSRAERRAGDQSRPTDA